MLSPALSPSYITNLGPTPAYTEFLQGIIPLRLPYAVSYESLDGEMDKLKVIS